MAGVGAAARERMYRAAVESMVDNGAEVEDAARLVSDIKARALEIAKLPARAREAAMEVSLRWVDVRVDRMLGRRAS